MIESTGAVVGHPRAELWWSALGAGVVVTVCVVILLTFLSTFVRDIEVRLVRAMAEAEATCAYLAESSSITVAAAEIKELAVRLERQASVVVPAGREQA